MAKINVGDEMLLRATVTRVDDEGNVTVEIGGLITIHHTLRADSSTIVSVTPKRK